MRKIIINNIKWFKQKCKPASDQNEIDQICKDLKEVLDKHPTGVGLACNQIGYDKNIALLRYDGQDIYLINPIIVEKSSKKVKSIEGCLSFPKKQATVKRNKSITIKITPDSEPVTFTGMLSNICQHELDHLNGILCFKNNGGGRTTIKKNKRKKRR